MTKVRTNRIPAELTERPQWVLWRYEERDGKLTKPPLKANGKGASHSNPSTWTSFDQALIACESEAGSFNGIGFVLSETDPYAGIDLDHCISPDGEIEPWAAQIIERMQSYCEISPSGTGVRIFLKGGLPEGAPRGGRKLTGLGDGTGAVEFYAQLRYLTVTGRHLAETPRTIEERGEAFHELYAELFPAKEQAPTRPAWRPVASLVLDDHELLLRMFKSKNGHAIERLWGGDTSSYGDDDSAADMALCNHLAWWTNSDLDRMDRMFRRSGLFRDKWDEKRGELTYGQNTLGEALASVRGGYEGPRAHEEVASSPESQESLAVAQAVLVDLSDQIKADSGYAFNPTVLQAFGLLRALDKASWQRARSILQKARISVRDVEKSLPPVSAFLPKPPDSPTGPSGKYLGDFIPDAPAPELLIPHPYYVDEDATGRLVASDNGNLTPAPFAFAPVVLVGRTRSVTNGAESLVLSWRWKNGPWQSRVVDRAQALNGRELIKLAAYGFPIADDSSKEMVGYLHRLEALNRPSLPCARVSSHLGWQGEGDNVPFLCGRSLILSNGAIEPVNALDAEHPDTWSEERICFQGSGEGHEWVVDAFHASGTFERWIEAIRFLQSYPIAQFVFYAGLAPVLLPLFNVPNFIIDISGSTSLGKTTTARAAASHWGNPDERSACSVVMTWDASRVGLERISEVLSCLPLCVDDTKKAKNPKMVADLIYAVASGRGRVRGSVKGLAHTPHWRTIMISTGEDPATSYTQDGGTRTRVLCLSDMPFGEQTVAAGRQIQKLNAELYRNYGHSGPLFLSWLQKNRHTWPEWQERYEALVVHYAESADAPEAGRLAQYAALIEIAGEMAHRALPLPWEFKSPVAVLWQGMAAEAADAAGAARALEDVLSWASSQEHKFLDRMPTSSFVERTPPEVYGRWESGDEWSFLAIYPTVLKEALVRFGYVPESILRNWRQKGWIKCRGRGFTTDIPVRDGTSTRKMVSIQRAAIDAVQA